MFRSCLSETFVYHYRLTSITTKYFYFYKKNVDEVHLDIMYSYGTHPIFSQRYVHQGTFGEVFHLSLTRISTIDGCLVVVLPWDLI